MERVFVSKDLPDEHLGRLEGYHVELWRGDGPVPSERLFDGVRHARGLLCMLTDRIDADLLAQSPDLVVISQVAVGVDNIDLGACAARGIVVGHTPDVLTETVADSAFALLSSIVRRLPRGGEGGPLRELGAVGDLPSRRR